MAVDGAEIRWDAAAIVVVAGAVDDADILVGEVRDLWASVGIAVADQWEMLEKTAHVPGLAGTTVVSATVVEVTAGNLHELVCKIVL